MNLYKKKKILLVLIILLLVLIGALIIVSKIHKKQEYYNIIENTTKSVEYSNQELLQDITKSTLEWTMLFSDINEFIIFDFEKIQSNIGKKNDIDNFYNKNKNIFIKDICQMEKTSLENLYSKIESQPIDFSKDYESCVFEEYGENAIKFEIVYENDFVLEGFINLDNTGKIFLVF